MFKKVFAFLLCTASDFTLSSCGKEAKVSPKAFNADFKDDIPDSFTAASGAKFELRWEKEKKRIVFYDKERNLPWSYLPYGKYAQQYDEDGTEINNHPQLESPIFVKYFDPEKSIEETLVSYTESVKKKKIRVKKIESGISVTYCFEKQKITVTVDYVLRRDSLKITVDPSKITESECTVLSVDIAPFFCSVPNTAENSYLFVPSGSGTIIRAGKESDNVTVYSEEVYGQDARRPDDDVIKTITANVNLPVYGAKIGNNAICAVIEEGAESATVTCNVRNSTVGYSTVYASFAVRSCSLMLTNTWNGQRKIYSEEMTQQPMSIGFYPLHDDANYVGMAKCYRNFLKSKYSMKSSEEEKLLNLEILGGAEYTRSFLGVPYNSLFVSTKISEAEEMLKEICNATGEAPAAQLLGFGESGTDIGKLAGGKLPKAFGSAKDVKNLSDYCKKNGVSLYWDFDVVQYSKSSSGASVTFDSAITTNGRRTTMYKYYLASGTRDNSSKGWNNSGSFTMLKRSGIVKKINSLTKQLDKYGMDGISLNTLSRIAYSDHNSQKYYSKGQMANQVSGIFNSLEKSGYKTAASAANDYAAASAGRIFDVPLSSSKYDCYDVDIPFYGIVFKGYVPLATAPLMTSEYDVNTRILQAAEAGYGLTFALTYNYNNKILTSENQLYYGSSFEKVKDTVSSAAAGYKDLFNSINGAEIVGHTVISDELRSTEYSNGVKVYVNYSANDVQTADGTVKAQSYLTVKGGAKND